MPLPDGYTGDTDASLDAAEISDRSRGVAVALGFLGGFFGLHRFYVGKVQSGLLMIVTLGGLGVWWLYDMILLASGEFRDKDDLLVRRWNVEDAQANRSGRGGGRPGAELEERLDQLSDQLNELAERVDFAERMLAQHRERGQLPRG